MKDLPTLPFALMLLGLLPFVMSAGAIYYVSPHEVNFLLNLIHHYSLFILVFLGGVNYGMASSNVDKPNSVWLFLWSAVPVLLAMALIVFPVHYFYIWLLAAYFIQWVMNWGMYCLDVSPCWYVKINSVGTVIVLVSLMILMIFGATG